MHAAQRRVKPGIICSNSEIPGGDAKTRDNPRELGILGRYANGSIAKLGLRTKLRRCNACSIHFQNEIGSIYIVSLHIPNQTRCGSPQSGFNESGLSVYCGQTF